MHTCTANSYKRRLNFDLSLSAFGLLNFLYSNVSNSVKSGCSHIVFVVNISC
jgi:hypothetical protein